MAGVALRIRLDDAGAVEGLAEYARRLREPGPALEEIGARLVLSTQRRFELQAGPDGVPWKPSRRARRERGQTLRDSGRLLSSITSRVAGRTVQVGTNVVYAAAHQFGARIRREARSQVLAFDRRGRFASRASTRRSRARVVPVAFAQIGAHDIGIPERPFLGLDESDRRAILRIVRNYLSRGDRKRVRR